ncbi:ADI_G0029310.mRNA.1.CDS.1 [Saccharomyces cerevisiae]|nr:ADI_G0029310.mRNA.1.CDS.1 [Saccharomyces cerevisiae]CAI6764049.1 ADI_G0029310.mRNA.1.CDS.1 [Saccharomyces cerevisiae]
MDRKRSFEKNCHFRHGRENVQKFLTFVEDEPDFQGGPILQKRITIPFLFFYLNRGYYNELSFPCPGTLSRNSECQAERQLYDAYFH